MKTEVNKRICPFSGEEFIPKRSNQIYANDKYRITYNNNKNNNKKKELAKKFKPIEREYEVLLRLLNGRKEIKVHKEYLRGAGFSFSLFTHIHYNTSIGKNCYALHAVHYYKVDQDYYKICTND